jgi:hypothetical protein
MHEDAICRIVLHHSDFLAVFALTSSIAGQSTARLPALKLLVDHGPSMTIVEHNQLTLITLIADIGSLSRALNGELVTFATLYTGGFRGFVASATAPIATGWSDPVPRVGLATTLGQRLFTAHNTVVLDICFRLPETMVRRSRSWRRDGRKLASGRGTFPDARQLRFTRPARGATHIHRDLPSLAAFDKLL